MPSLPEDLRRALDGPVADDEWTRHLYSRDASMYAITPQAVAFPRSAQDVAAAVAVAGDHGVPVLARGAGTSLAGQCVGPGLVLDLSRHLDRVLDLDPEAATATVEPGVVALDLNRAAAAYGLMFGPDTSTGDRATIGGMVGNNSAGSGSVRYGMTADHVRALDVVLADATVSRLAPVDEAERVRRSQGSSLDARLHAELPGLLGRHADAIATGYPAHWRRAGGYRLDRLAATHRLGRLDPSRLVVGSEGTLAVVTAATVGLVPRPRRIVYAVGHFSSVAAAIDAVADALACDPVQVELIDRTILDLARSKVAYSALAVDGDPDALLYVAFSGGDEVDDQLDRLERAWASHGHGYATVRAVTAEQQQALLAVRTAGLGLLMAASSGSRRPVAFVEDTAVDPEHLADYTARLRSVLDRHGLRAGFYGHASVGCLHVRPFVDTADPAEVATMRAVAEEVRALAAEYGGSNSSEHGDGLARSEFNRTLFGDDLYEAMREVKGLFDPTGLLNPGKVVDAPPMTEHLRVLPAAPEHRTTLAFATGGMRAAADRCQNIGLCRKTTTGVMCPSYIATRDEEHSTRGRAGALVKALSDADPSTALADDHLHEVLDLCLMCKACTSECPLGVDISALKSEALAARHALHGTPVRSRAFAAIRTLNRLGAATAPVSNALPRLPGVRLLLDRGLGITRERPLPRFERATTTRWDARRRRSAGQDRSAPLGTLTMLADSFTTYTEPTVGRVAVELLELAGWSVRLESGGCCGRAAMSKGLVEQAAHQARAFARLVGAGLVVGVEPSCTGMLREPGLDLGLDVREVDALLVDALDAGRLRLREDSWLSGRRVLVHGHCHQKADVGTGATLALLGRIPGAEVVGLDAGCCGMAGSFGFEREHYRLSMQVGADRLFPAVAAEPAGTVVAATGVSCRQQIRHGTGRRAVHPLELVRSVAVTEPAAVDAAQG